MNAYVVGMFQPLSFLGTIYGMVIQAFVDIKNLSQLLTEPIEVTDVENAAPLPFTESGKGVKTSGCKKCKRVWDSDQVGTGVWRYCPFCGADNLEQITSSPLHGSSDIATGGVSVEFKSKFLLLHWYLA